MESVQFYRIKKKNKKNKIKERKRKPMIKAYMNKRKATRGYDWRLK